MKTLLAILVLSFSAQSFSTTLSCGERLRNILSGTKRPSVINREIYRKAAPALAHYRKYITKEDVAIESVEAYHRGVSITGYKVEINGFGDESIVSYYFDHNFKLVSGYWHNQSPERFWFCK